MTMRERSGYWILRIVMALLRWYFKNRTVHLASDWTPGTLTFMIPDARRPCVVKFTALEGPRTRTGSLRDLWFANGVWYFG